MDGSALNLGLSEMASSIDMFRTTEQNNPGSFTAAWANTYLYPSWKNMWTEFNTSR
jgi:hypothetical protein